MGRARARRAATSSPTSSTRRSQSFGLWVEQLIAESTGKQGKGIVPIAGEPLGDPADYGDDRTFLYLRHVDEPDAEHDAKIEALAKAGHPVIIRTIHGPTDLGRLFFFAEFAIAVAGLGARDQPVRPAQRAGGQGRHEAACSKEGARRTSPTPTTTRCARC